MHGIIKKEKKKLEEITFNALLNHKAHNYKPMQYEVENAAFSDDEDMNESKDMRM